MSNISLFTTPCIYFCLGLAQTHGAHFRDTVSVYLPNKGTFSPVKNQTHTQSDNTHT